MKSPGRWISASAAVLILAVGVVLGPACEDDASDGPVQDAGMDGSDPAGPCDEEGEVQTCYPGDPAQQGIGECTNGTTTCRAGQWGPCEGYGLPAEEICDELDNSCDGVVDEGCGCEVGETRTCYSGPASTQGIGACTDGEQLCEQGSWSAACTGEVLPTDEDCDGRDNDCDGLTDEGCSCVDGQTQPCYGGPPDTQNVGVCHGGNQLCTGGAWADECTDQVVPSPENCNDADDDCDGSVDEGDPGSGGDCLTGLPGVCADGALVCTDGSLLCVQNTQPSSELCNGLDDDCDGSTDEGNPGGGANCSTGQPGICAEGTMVCQGQHVQCVPNQPAGPEDCDNGLDDDCDGDTDCGEDADCDGSEAPATGWGETSCRCQATLGSCDADVPCGECHYSGGTHYWCRKVDGTWQWHEAWDPDDSGICPGEHCLVACCETSDVWCNNGTWVEGFPTSGQCPGIPHSYSCK